MNTALLVRLRTAPGQHPAVEKLLIAASQQARQERPATPWFALRFRRSEYGIFVAFADEAARDAHRTQLATALPQPSEAVLARPPEITNLDVLAHKRPATPPSPSTKALLLTLHARAGRGQQAADFLRDARRFVVDEPQTTAWFAIRHKDGNYGIFDAFPNNRGRIKHLTGHVSRELVKHAHSLLGRVPDLDLPDVLADTVAPMPTHP